MSQRLAELQRQRALVAEHLAWLDREIAAAASSETSLAQGSARPAVTAAPLPPPTSRDPVLPPRPGNVPSAVPLATGAGDATADVILSEYRGSSGSVRDEVRKGCLLYFVLAFLILGLAVSALYIAFRR